MAPMRPNTPTTAPRRAFGASWPSSALPVMITEISPMPTNTHATSAMFEVRVLHQRHAEIGGAGNRKRNAHRENPVHAIHEPADKERPKQDRHH